MQRRVGEDARAHGAGVAHVDQRHRRSLAKGSTILLSVLIEAHLAERS
jgi:hypothetical protein